MNIRYKDMWRFFVLVSIVGSPGSGKTTAAAMAFAYLKEQGIVAEFIPEQARLHIAELRVQRKLKPTDKFDLTGQDQIDIMVKQIVIDQLMMEACGPEVIIISDSSPLNALLYMDEQVRTSEAVKALTTSALLLADVVYWAKPLRFFQEGDPNRLHSQSYSADFDKRIPQLLDWCPSLKFADIIEGDAQSRMFRIVEDVLERCTR